MSDVNVAVAVAVVVGDETVPQKNSVEPEWGFVMN